MCRTDDQRETHRSIVVPPLGGLSYAGAALCAKCVNSVDRRRESTARWIPVGEIPRASGLSGDGLRPASAPSDRMSGHSGRAIVTEISLLGAASCVGVIETHHGTTTLGNLFATVVADEDRLSRHVILLRVRCAWSRERRKVVGKTQAYCRRGNSPSDPPVGSRA